MATYLKLHISQQQLDVIKTMVAPDFDFDTWVEDCVTIVPNYEW